MRKLLLNPTPLFRKLRQLTLLLSLLLVPQLAGAVNYDITIAGIQVTDGNATNITGTGITGTVSYDATNKILTLNGATINGTIESSLDNLSIHLTGTNSIRGNTTALLNGIKSTNGGKLTFTADANAALTITTSGDAASAITGFSNVTMGTGAYLQTNIPTKYDTNGKNFREQVSSANIVKELNITSTPSYPLWIGNTQFTSAGTSIPTGFSFNATGNILTLTSVTQVNPLISGLPNLTIALDGNSKITRDDSTTIIRSINPEAALTFQAGTGDCSLYLKNSATFTPPSPLIKNFASISYSGLNYSSKSGNPINDATTHEAILSSATIYPLWIGNTPVTSTTTSGTGWSYDNNNKKLTLNGGTNTAPTTITGQIISGIGDLTIFLTGTTILKAADSETSLINSTNNGILSFDTNPTAIGSLAFKDNTGSAVFAGEPISGFTSKTYSNGIDYDATNKKIGIITYPLQIGSTYITSASKTDVLGDGHKLVTYNSEENTLTLNDGAAITETIWYNGTPVLNIALNGTSSVISSSGTAAIYSNGGNFNIVMAPGATKAELTATAGNGATYSITTYTLGSGLYSKPIALNSTIITTNPDFVLYNGYVMTNGQTISDTQQTPGTVTYTENGSEKTLTFTNFQSAYGNSPYLSLVNAIETGVDELKVVLIGNNKITCNDDGAFAFKGIQTNASIQFIKGSDGCKLTMDTKTANPLSFGSGKATYDKLIYYSSGGNEKYICEPMAPVMEPNANNEVRLAKPYDDGSIKYSIVYADGTAGVSDATYSTPFAMAAPGTVTAWVEANNVTTSTVKGKYFGYQDAPFTMLPGNTKTPVLIPAIVTGDDISCRSYSSSDDNLATFVGGVITAVAFGNATLTTSMETTGTAILNYNNQIKTVVKVAKDITGISFSGNAQYSSYCNTDADDLTLPNGIKAYAVKIPTSGNEVVLSEIGFIPGTVNSQNPIYTPILLKRDDTSKTSFGTVTKYVRESGYTLPSNDLKFTTAGENTNDKECYILYKDAFVKATGTIAQNRCYLEKPSTNPNPARGFVIEGGDDGSTAIDDTLINEEETGNGEWYDLQGRRIQKPTKPGLYIVNGKKVVVNNK